MIVRVMRTVQRSQSKSIHAWRWGTGHCAGGRVVGGMGMHVHAMHPHPAQPVVFVHRAGALQRRQFCIVPKAAAATETEAPAVGTVPDDGVSIIVV